MHSPGPIASQVPTYVLPTSNEVVPYDETQNINGTTYYAYEMAQEKHMQWLAYLWHVHAYYEQANYLYANAIAIQNASSQNDTTAVNVSGTIFGPKGANLFVFHLPDVLDEDHIMDIFGTCGTVVSATISRNKWGRKLGYGFVSYFAAEDATRAISELDGLNIDGKKLRIQHKKHDIGV